MKKGLILILLFGLGIVLTPPAHASTSGPFLITTLTNGVANAGLEFPPQQRAFYDVGDHWVFYVGPVGGGSCRSGTTCLFSACSVTGSSWTISNTGFLMDTREYSVFDKSGMVYLAAYNSTQHTLNSALYFASGTLNGSACTISWGAEQTVKAASATAAWDYPALALDSNSQAYIVYDQNAPAEAFDTAATTIDVRLTSCGGCSWNVTATAAAANEFAVITSFSDALSPIPTAVTDGGDTFTQAFSSIGCSGCVTLTPTMVIWTGTLAASGSHTFQVKYPASCQSICNAGGSVELFQNIGAVGSAFFSMSVAQGNGNLTATNQVSNDFIVGGTFTKDSLCRITPVLLASTTTRGTDACAGASGTMYFRTGDQNPSSAGSQSWLTRSTGSLGCGCSSAVIDLVPVGTVRAIRSSGTNYASWTGDVQLNGTAAAHWRPAITSLTNGKVYAAYLTSAQSGVWGNLYNSGWQSAERAELPAQDQGTNEVYLFNDGKTDQVYDFWQSVDKTLRAQTRTAGGTWMNNNNGTFEQVTAPLQDSFAASYDSTQDLFYVYNYDVPNNRITQTVGTFAKGWSSTTTFLTTVPFVGSTTADNLAVEPTATIANNFGSFGVVFTSNTISGTSTSLYFALVSYSESNPGTVTPVTGNLPVPFNFKTATINLFGYNLTVPVELTANSTAFVAGIVALAVLLSSNEQIGVLIEDTKKKKQQTHLTRVQQFKAATIVATTTLLLDYLFHLTATQPMEVPVYFAMKFFSSLVIAYFLIPRIGNFLSAAVFTLWVDVYYGLFVVLLGVYWLSSSPNQVISIFGIMNQIVLFLLWTMAHGLFFLSGTVVASELIKGRTVSRRRESLI